MIPLLTQEEFETLRSSELEKPALIYFTAKWCGPCRAFDWGSIKDSLKGYSLFICDVDDNNYTPGFCGVRSIPNFLVIKTDKKIKGPTQTSNSLKLLDWLKEDI
jgi:thiol-disulfide isomerase/thioredoxin